MNRLQIIDYMIILSSIFIMYAFINNREISHYTYLGISTFFQIQRGKKFKKISTILKYFITVG